MNQFLVQGLSPHFAQLALPMPKPTEASKTTDVSHPLLGGLCRRVGAWLEAVAGDAVLQSSAATHGWGELSLGLPPGQFMAASRSGEISPVKRVSSFRKGISAGSSGAAPLCTTSLRAQSWAGAGQTPALSTGSPRPPAPQRSQARTCI